MVKIIKLKTLLERDKPKVIFIEPVILSENIEENFKGKFNYYNKDKNIILTSKMIEKLNRGYALRIKLDGDDEEFYLYKVDEKDFDETNLELYEAFEQ